MTETLGPTYGGHYMEGIGLKFTPVIVRHLLGSLSMLGLWLILVGVITSPTIPYRGLTCLQLPILPHFPHTHPTLISNACDITEVVTNVHQYLPVLAS